MADSGFWSALLAERKARWDGLRHESAFAVPLGAGTPLTS